MPNRTSDDIVNELLGLAGQAEGDERRDDQRDDHNKRIHKLKRSEDEAHTKRVTALLDECMAEVDQEEGQNKFTASRPVSQLRTFDHDAFQLAGGDQSKLKTIYTLADIQGFNLPKAAFCTQPAM